MGRKISGKATETSVSTVEPGKNLMYIVCTYILIVIAGAGLFALWPSTSSYAWMDLKSPAFLWIGVGCVSVSFVLIVLYMIFGVKGNNTKN